MRFPASMGENSVLLSALPALTLSASLFKARNAALEINRTLCVAYNTEWLVKHKLMRVLNGRVAADDAYLGGIRKAKRGSGAAGKVAPVTGVKTRAAQYSGAICPQ